MKFNMKFSYFNTFLLLCLLGFATFLSVNSYQSFEPLIIHLIFWLLPLVVMKSVVGVKAHYKLIYTAIINICFFTAGIAAISANQFDDPFQNSSDAYWFYQNSISRDGYDAIVLAFAYEGYLALSIWRWLYEFLGNFGFSDDRFIGISLNCMLVAFSGVITLKTCDILYKSDQKRLNRITIYICLCGIFWLFASLHLRDAFVLLFVSILLYYWINFLHYPTTFIQILFLLIICIVLSLGLLFLRREFVFLPGFFAISAITAIIFTEETKTQHKLFLSIAVLTCAFFLIFQFGGSFVEQFVGVSSDYEQHMKSSNQALSLGLSLIINQNIFIKTILGSGYVLLFPIPFWSGFGIGSAYNIFKSANVLLMYFMLPAYFTAIQKVLLQKSFRKPALIFLLYVSIGSLFSIVLTSFETRHLGVFYGAFFLLACLPKLDERKDKRLFKIYFSLLLSFMGLIHIAWIIIKL